MRESSFSFLKEYVDAISPSGFEEKAARIWRDRAEEFADEVRGDLHGNSFAVVNPGGSPRIMFAGHTDEIGLMVSNINDKGFLFFNTIGGWDPQILVGQRVRLLGKEGVVKGVIGRRPVHLLEEEDKKKVVKPEQLWIDIGAEDKDQASERVGIGTPAV
ncbi:MAG: M42 family peptidase, partial [Candidatus Bipolaricaulota bacterium]